MNPFHDAISRRLGIIQSIGTDATEQQAGMLARRRTAQAAQAQTSGYGGSQGGPGPEGIFTTGRNSNARWEDFGLELQRLGYRVSENPDKRFGGRVGKHSNGSRHYNGRAFDVNWGPGGQSRQEQEMLAKAVALSKNYGIPQAIFMKPGHYGHAHFGW